MAGLLRTLRRMIGRRPDPPPGDTREALHRAARRHLTSLDRARRVLPGDPVIEQRYSQMRDIIARGESFDAGSDRP